MSGAFFFLRINGGYLDAINSSYQVGWGFDRPKITPNPSKPLQILNVLCAHSELEAKLVKIGRRRDYDEVPTPPKMYTLEIQVPLSILNFQAYRNLLIEMPIKLSHLKIIDCWTKTRVVSRAWSRPNPHQRPGLVVVDQRFVNWVLGFFPKPQTSGCMIPIYRYDANVCLCKGVVQREIIDVLIQPFFWVSLKVCRRQTGSIINWLVLVEDEHPWAKDGHVPLLNDL